MTGAGRADEAGPDPAARDTAARLAAVEAIVDVGLEPLTVDELLDALLTRLQETLTADTVTILLREGDKLVVAASKGLERGAETSQQIPIGRGVAGRVAATREPAVIPDLRSEAEAWSRLLRERLRSLVAVPLVYGDDVIGVLHVGSDTPRDFVGDVLVLELVAERAATAIARARAEEERRERELRTRLLADLSHQLSEGLDTVETAIQLVAKQIATTIGDGCAVFLLTDDRRSLEMVAMHHANPELLELAQAVAQRHLPLDNELGEVIRTNETRALYDLTAETFERMLTPAHRAVAGERFAISSMITAPLRARGDVIGVATIVRTDPTAPHYTPADRTFLENLAARAAIAIDNALLYRRAHESERRMRALFNSARIGFVARDAHGRAVEANDAYAAMMGYASADDVIGVELEAMGSPGDAEDTRTRFAQVFGGGSDHVEHEHTYLRRDGTPVHARISTSVVRDANGQPQYALSLVENVTDRRRLEEQLRESQKMEALGRLAGGIAHDFNNVLAAITGISELLASDLHPDDPHRAEADEILAAANRAAGLTRQLLTFSRRQVARREPVEVARVVEDLAPMLARLLGEDVQLTLDLSPSTGIVEADRTHIEQVIVNLAINARDAMPRGGRLAIDVRAIDLDDEFIESRLALEPGPYVVLAITDTGHGMDAQTRSHIFEPFFTTKTADRGSGLGLSTVFGIVQQSSGEIGVYSEPGEGTTFRIYLPRVGASAPPAPGAPEAAPRASGNHTILVVDDEDAVRRVVKRMLERAGYAVLEAANGDEALHVAAQHPGSIDLLIADVVLPGASGPQVAESLREQQSELKVVFSSGYPGDEVARRGLDGADAFVEKPFSRDKMLRTVADVLAGRSAPEAAGS